MSRVPPARSMRVGAEVTIRTTRLYECAGPASWGSITVRQLFQGRKPAGGTHGCPSVASVPYGAALSDHNWRGARVLGAGAGRRLGRPADLLEGRVADSPTEVPAVPPAEFDRADVTHHIPGCAAVGAFDQAACHHAPDAA